MGVRGLGRWGTDYPASECEAVSIRPEGAQIPSRRQTILVNYTAKSIAALDTSAAPIWRRQPHRLRWREGALSARSSRANATRRRWPP